MDEETPHRSTKKRRQWCKGKTGVEHVPTVRRRSWGRAFDFSCADLWWNTEARKMAQRDPRAHPRFRKNDKGWDCRHEQYCTNCGKVLARSLGENCPDRGRA